MHFPFKEKCKDRTNKITVDDRKGQETMAKTSAVRKLQKEKTVPKSSSKYKLNPFLENLVLKVRGRIGHAALAVMENMKIPVILWRWRMQIAELVKQLTNA